MRSSGNMPPGLTDRNGHQISEHSHIHMLLYTIAIICVSCQPHNNQIYRAVVKLHTSPIETYILTYMHIRVASRSPEAKQVRIRALRTARWSNWKRRCMRRSPPRISTHRLAPWHCSHGTLSLAATETPCNCSHVRENAWKTMKRTINLEP